MLETYARILKLCGREPVLPPSVKVGQSCNSYQHAEIMLAPLSACCMLTIRLAMPPLLTHRVHRRRLGRSLQQLSRCRLRLAW